MNRMKLFAAILVFGSFWGLSEVLIGSSLHNMGLPSGAIMSGIFALTILVLSRMIFRQTGMQLGIGFIAGALRMFNPFIGCHLCSAIAIVAEGALFELIWYKLSFDSEYLEKPYMQASMGIITAYVLFVGGHIVTQILTPIVAGATFYVQNLIVFMPRIIAGGLLPAITGGVVLPIITLSKNLDITLKDKVYYPTTLGISLICWLLILGNFLLA